LKVPAGRPSSRKRILEAAEALAREQGPGNISLDAVAARAGLSKGGLLYNFPTKAKLLEALVEMHIERAETALAQSIDAGPEGRNAMALAYLRYCRQEMIDRPEPASGVLAAIAENPEFIDPVRRYQKQVMERLRERSADFAGLPGHRGVMVAPTDGERLHPSRRSPARAGQVGTGT
jgi:AcrR family transcriptional regulator